MRWFAGALTAIMLGGCTTGTATSTASTTRSTTSRPAVSSSGIAACSTVPAEVGDTVEAIQDGGPFLRRKDGSTYRNRNRFLPVRAQGYYREYTVKTPGTNSAGARRVVTGGNPRTDPPWFFYTHDHYDTFCQLEVP